MRREYSSCQGRGGVNYTSLTMKPLSQHSPGTTEAEGQFDYRCGSLYFILGHEQDCY